MDKQELRRALATIWSIFLRVREHPTELYFDPEQRSQLTNTMDVLSKAQTVDDVIGRRLGDLLDCIRASGIISTHARKITGCDRVIQKCEDLQRDIGERE